MVVFLILLLFLWLMSMRRGLLALNEDVDNAMARIGVLLSSRFDALEAFLDLARGYAEQDARVLTETVRAGRRVVTAGFTPDEVLEQERLILDALKRIAMVAEQHPELKADEKYSRCMDAVDRYGQMARISCFIYNDSVAKLNRAIRTPPDRLAAWLLGFHKRDCLESSENGESDMQHVDIIGRIGE